MLGGQQSFEAYAGTEVCVIDRIARMLMCLRVFMEVVFRYTLHEGEKTQRPIRALNFEGTKVLKAEHGPGLSLNCTHLWIIAEIT